MSLNKSLNESLQCYFRMSKFNPTPQLGGVLKSSTDQASYKGDKLISSFKRDAVVTCKSYSCSALLSAYLLLVASINGVSSIYAWIMRRLQRISITIINRGPIISPAPGVAKIHSKLLSKDIPIENHHKDLKLNIYALISKNPENVVIFLN